jgi:hypothetical protein
MLLFYGPLTLHADDCRDALIFVNEVKGLIMNSLQNLSGPERQEALKNGRFDARPVSRLGETFSTRLAITLGADGKVYLKGSLKAPDPAPHVITVNFRKNNGILINFVYGASGRFSCPYLLFLDGDKIGIVRLQGFTSIKDLDGDGVDEIAVLENLYDKFKMCDPPQYLIPSWTEIFNFDSERKQMVNVSDRHPGFYAARLKRLKEDYESFWSGTKCRQAFEELIRKTESFARLK